MSTQRSQKKIDGITWCSVVKVKVGIQFTVSSTVAPRRLALFVFWGVANLFIGADWRRFLPSCQAASGGFAACRWATF